MKSRLSNKHRHLALLLIVAVTSTASALDDPIATPITKGAIRLELETVASGLNSPNFLTHAGDGTDRLFFTEQGGRVRLIENGLLSPTPFLDVSSRLPDDFGFPIPGFTFDERGLLGAAFHPDFASNGAFYTFTSENIAGPADFSVTLPLGETFNHQSVVAEWRVDSQNPNTIDPGSRRELLRIDNPQFNHNGGMLNFGHDGLLYVAVGDGGNADDVGPGHSFPQGNGQDPGNVLGTILRIDVDGNNSDNAAYGIPGDNPFFGGTLDPGGEIADEIYATGFRNPFRFSVDGATGDLVIADVGQGNIEEVDVLNGTNAGGNFGWNLKEGSFRFDPNTGDVSIDPGGPLTNGLIDPVLEYDHDEGISIIGGFVYYGDALPELQGKYVFGDFSLGFFSPNGRLFYGDLESGLIEEFIIGLDDRDLGLFVKGFGEDADGEIYLLADSALGPMTLGVGGVGVPTLQGQILKLVPAPVPLPAGVWLLGTGITGLFLARRRSPVRPCRTGG